MIDELDFVKLWMKRRILKSDLVSVEWLHSNLQLSGLILLDATINKKIDNDSERVPSARFFDIKQKFSDTNARFPSS